MIKELVRRPLRAIGIDVVRWLPPAPRTESTEITFPSTLWLGRYDIRTILDIGANEGSFATTMARRFPNAKIYSFEPLADVYVQLCKKIAPEPRCKAFNFALGEEKGVSEIRRSSFSPSSSLMKMTDLHKAAFPVTAGPETIQAIQVRRLDDMAREMELCDGLFVKIDVQGFEMHVIRGGQQVLRKAAVVIVEASIEPMYEGQPLFDDIYAIMKDLGFAYVGNWDQLVDPRTERILQVDGIFVREPNYRVPH